MLSDAFGALGDYMTVLIETNPDEPIIDVSRPLTVWQQRFRGGSQCAKHIRNLPVMPADENYLGLVICTQLSCKISWLLVGKAIVDWQVCRLCKGLDR